MINSQIKTNAYLKWTKITEKLIKLKEELQETQKEYDLAKSSYDDIRNVLYEDAYKELDKIFPRNKQKCLSSKNS